jgi:hypothetical protein
LLFGRVSSVERERSTTPAPPFDHENSLQLLSLWSKLFAPGTGANTAGYGDGGR